MNITSAKYLEMEVQGVTQNVAVEIVVDGITMAVPMDSNNSDYIEIQRQVNEGTLTIADADSD